MEILDLRHFSSADLRPLLEEEIVIWGHLLSWDYNTSAEMILRDMDAKILPGYAAIERGSICGYSFFVYEQNKGVVEISSYAEKAAALTGARSRNGCSRTSLKLCSNRPVSIAWRRNCCCMKPEKSRDPSCNRGSVATRVAL